MGHPNAVCGVTMTKTGPDHIDDIGQSPTLDDYLDRDPKELTMDDARAMIELLRDQRARWVSAEEKKREEKE